MWSLQTRIEKSFSYSNSYSYSNLKSPSYAIRTGTPRKIGSGCAPISQILAIFNFKKCDFPYPSFDMTKNSIPYLSPGDRVSRVPKCFRTRKAVASQTLWLQTYSWYEERFSLCKKFLAYTTALWARKVSETFEKRASRAYFSKALVNLYPASDKLLVWSKELLVKQLFKACDLATAFQVLKAL